MSDPVLHIKDSYYFEIPKFMLPARYTDKSQFPAVWVKNDPDFQHFEAEAIYHGLDKLSAGKVKLPDEHDLLHSWEHWQHAGANHANFAKPLDGYLDESRNQLIAEFNTRAIELDRALKEAGKPVMTTEQRAAEWTKFIDAKEAAHVENVWFTRLVPPSDKAAEKSWSEIKQETGSDQAVRVFQEKSPIKWSEAKLAKYNDHLSGKVLIPQPFAELRNMYEADSGFAISKLMIVEVLVGIVMFAVFTWVASRVQAGMVPRGRLLNLFEVFLVFIRDQIARPAIGGGHHEEAHADEGHVDLKGTAPVHDNGGELPGIPTSVPQGHGHQDEVKHGHAHDEHDHHVNEADRFVPLLWTIFFFVLGCNLFGLVPWLGGPTATFGVTFALAFCTFLVVCISGMRTFGFVGFFMNQIPSMDLPLPLAVVLKPMIFGIEMMGLLIKHLVLSIRLLANMVAGHLVILGILAVAFGTEAALTFSTPENSWAWWIAAPVAIVAATVFNVLELFVAFLQAYIFTFLTALFIGASVHKH